MNPLERARRFAKFVFGRQDEALTMLELHCGHIPDLSVNDEVAAELLHKRWVAAIRVELPTEPATLPLDDVLDFACGRLKGRKPFFYRRGNCIDGFYSTDSANDAARQQVDEFTLHLALAIGSLPTAVKCATVCAYSFGDAEQFLSQARRQEPYGADTPDATRLVD